MEVLNDLQHDTLTETFNLGMGAAASALSKIVDEDVTLSVPQLVFMTRADVVKEISNEIKSVTGVIQQFNGMIGGQAMLLFPGSKSMELVRLLLKDIVPMSELTEFEEEALSEIGNIIINNTLASLADMFHGEITTELPAFAQGPCSSILSTNTNSIGVTDIVIFLRIDFALEKYAVNGFITIILDIESIQDLAHSIDRHLKRSGLTL